MSYSFHSIKVNSQSNMQKNSQGTATLDVAPMIHVDSRYGDTSSDFMSSSNIRNIELKQSSLASYISSNQNIQQLGEFSYLSPI